MKDLSSYFQTEGKQKIAKDLGIKNIMAVPKLIKVVINVGLGEATTNKKIIEIVLKQLASITGQRPITTVARKDISSFKLRKGDPIGLKVTLRSRKMYDFIEKLTKIVLPRIRDFRGVSEKGFDSYGNYTLGLAEQIVFPEADMSQMDKIRGLEITLVTSSKNKDYSKKLMEVLGFPFKKKQADAK